MSALAGTGHSSSYLAGLIALVRTSLWQLVRPPSHSRRAEAARRLARHGLLITAMTIRTDMQIQSLSFTASTNKREALDVTIQLAYMPLPGALGKLLDLASVGIGALMDAGGN